MYQIPQPKLKDDGKDTYSRQEVEQILNEAMVAFGEFMVNMRKEAVQARLISYITFVIAVLLIMDKLI